MNLVKSLSERSLATQFALAGGVVMVLSMIIIANWVAARIEGVVVRNTANGTAQYMESFIAPLSQDIAGADRLSPGARRALDEVFDTTRLGERVASFKLWKPDGLIVEASDKALVGQRFEVSDNLRGALAGEVRADFQNLGDAEDAGESALGLPLLEIYSPIREVWSGRIIGVVEFYEVATALERDLIEARRKSWLAVALVLAAIGASLYAIVLRGSRTIDRQRATLRAQVAALGSLSERNTALRLRVQDAAARASAMHDGALRRIGADLHDGPAQLMGFAALGLDHLRAPVAGTPAEADLDAVERAVKDAIREVRTISRGLSLPDIEDREPCEILRGVAEAHAVRTATGVAVDCAVPAGVSLPAAVKICLYRFVQEGLNNAWRYAGGAGQDVALSLAGGQLTLAVRDRGPGFAADAQTAGAEGAGPGTVSQDEDEGGAADEIGGLGLVGLRDRVESLGGVMTIGPRPGGGAEIRMTLELRG